MADEAVDERESRETEPSHAPSREEANSSRNEELWLGYRSELAQLEQKSQDTYDKAILTLSGGALGISMAVVKDYLDRKSGTRSLLVGAWLSWALSLAAILFSFESSRSSLRKALARLDAGARTLQELRSLSTKLTSALNWVAGVLFVVGVILFAAFVITAHAQDPTREDKFSNSDFDSTLKEVEEILQIRKEAFEMRRAAMRRAKPVDCVTGCRRSIDDAWLIPAPGEEALWQSVLIRYVKALELREEMDQLRVRGYDSEADRREILLAEILHSLGLELRDLPIVVRILGEMLQGHGLPLPPPYQPTSTQPKRYGGGTLE
jgi:hypothetical protein